MISTVRVTRYRCDTCGRTWSKRATAEAHHPHCFKRDDRTPYLGELSSAWAPEREWRAPPWWPGPGKMWTGDTWVDVPGYQTTSWDGMAADVWPEVDGQPLDRVPAAARPHALEAR